MGFRVVEIADTPQEVYSESRRRLRDASGPASPTPVTGAEPDELHFADADASPSPYRARQMPAST